MLAIPGTSTALRLTGTPIIARPPEIPGAPNCVGDSAAPAGGRGARAVAASEQDSDAAFDAALVGSAATRSLSLAVSSAIRSLLAATSVSR